MLGAVPGTLFVVATPLGNLDDLSPRALETLSRVKAVACEDTRRTAKLLARHGIEVPTLSCHRFNERARLEPILEQLRSGNDLALVSDGGTPGVADPGALLVRAALDSGLRVSPLRQPRSTQLFQRGYHRLHHPLHSSLWLLIFGRQTSSGRNILRHGPPF